MTSVEIENANVPFPTSNMADIMPTAVDAQVQIAFHTCWMSLPKERRNVEELIRVMSLIVERQIQALKENQGIFADRPKT